MGWQPHAIHGQPAPALLFGGIHPREIANRQKSRSSTLPPDLSKSTVTKM
jgi:hypothetical protein